MNDKNGEKHKPKDKNKHIEESYYRLHGFKPEVYVEEITGNEKYVRIVLGNREVIMHHIYKKQKDPVVTVEFGEVIKQYNSVFKAELDINKYLRGK